MSTDVLPPGTGLEGVFVLSGALEHGIPGAERASVTSTGDQPERIASAIARAEHIVDEAGPSYVSCREKLHALKQRLREERFHLAVLGQFKRGKSTLLNALLEEEALPVSVIPLTAIPTFIRSGDRRHARVIFNGGESSIERDAANTQELSEFLAQYVTEEANPANRLGVSYVEVLHPAPFLRAGVVLIDTPGIGSTHRHNTEATLNFIPQCDAALFVVSPDPPITEVEIEFLREVQSRISRVFYVLSKADYLEDSDKNKILAFLQGVLHDQAGVGTDVPILPVSARLGLEARKRGDGEEWAKSGMRDIENLLLDFLVHEKESALAEAISSKASDVIGEVLLEMRLSVQSLRMPLEALETRLETLKSILAEADSQRTSEKDLLEGDRKRMAALLEEQAELLRRKARQKFLQVAKSALEEHYLNTDAAQRALAEVIPGFFEHELGDMSRAFECQVRDALNRHRQRTDALIESIRRTAAELFDIQYQPLTSREEFEIKREPYWVTHHWPISLGVLPEGFWDKLLPHGIRKSRAIRRMRERIEVLVAENVENVRWPTLQNLQKSFREFGNAIDARLQEAVSATKGAIEAAYEKRKTQSTLVETEKVRLERDIAKLEQIDEDLRAYRGANGKRG
jgi:tRNA U34 5-carboxymethylaminomethyl modifying GTPase MnmE/TrmE